ncbi:type II secretion system protein E [Hydrogenobacter thermophilus TK-6]|uniref:General secretion pathway protein E n=1 Tax=Hydrogenobacter thermophilus (strain DSM 6534 / IAM 12695 / TK-6) TaxID=608538 RepID=D3DKB9_HYDTT|nr:GspE/PulE family protein [Hydrogenobacter thermophilus]ADO46191.1 type II secretion system protein E [Hydrogenobacter thermophilus TK-6]BAI70271.1 general secretion pathway protein E [Hydrogenobacter thermophilus TK-6]
MDILKTYRLVPVEEGEDYIKLLVPRGYDPLVIEEIRFLTGKSVEALEVDGEEFSKELQNRLAQEEVYVEELKEEEDSKRDILLEEEKSPAVSFVNSTLIKATTLSASDIHIEPYEDGSLVRLRLDGVLHDYVSLPLSLHESVVSRIKVLANLNVAERRVPQDGKIRVRIGKRDLDIRVSIVPTTFGERVVLRLLDKSGTMLTLQELGLSEEDLEKVKRLAQKPYGIVLATGPTGAGKSTTLYAMILHIKSPHKNIITIEDPPEYQVKGVSQIQVNPKVGLTFASGLRAILRQDPDVIMVGEIRDGETAQIAVHAALTGHLVLSTLHTNDAPSAITRLSDLGIEPFLIASSLEGVLAQRLVRKVCEYCKEPYKPTKEELHQLGLDGDYTFYRGRGCEMCMGTGYRGRMGIYEVLELDEELKQLILKTQDANDIRKKAKEKGFRSMYEDGLEKVIMGITTPEELIRAVKVEE